MSHSEQIHEIAGALASAQLEMSSASKNCTNPHFKSKYADINDFLLAVRPFLAKQGIATSQMPDVKDGVIVLETMLIHKASGQWLKSTLPINIKPGGNEMQALGSVLTYLRRFCLSAISGIASEEEDDDGNGAGTYQAAPQKVTSPPAPIKMINEFQVATLKKELDACSKEFKDKLQSFMTENRFTSYSQLPEATFHTIIRGTMEDVIKMKTQTKEVAS
jgi:hypothetical protein